MSATSWRPVYLIHGDDHGRVGERRASLRAKAEAESGAGGIEVLEGDAAAPENVALALLAMTFAMGRRFVIVEGVQEWKDADVKEHVAPALRSMAPETTVALFGRDDGRKATSQLLVKVVRDIGGVVGVEAQVKGKELPRWAIDEAQKLGLALDPSAAQALVARVGERQQRLLRELEKLWLAHGDGAAIGLDEVEESTAAAAEREIWGFVDALAARNHKAALRGLLALQAQGESVPRLNGVMARRVRELLTISLRLERGESPADVKASMKGNPWALDRRIKEARASDSDALRDALEALAALEVDTRGQSELADQTLAVRALARIAA